jgi:hypothetical protein
VREECAEELAEVCQAVTEDFCEEKCDVIEVEVMPISVFLVLGFNNYFGKLLYCTTVAR